MLKLNYKCLRYNNNINIIKEVQDLLQFSYDGIQLINTTKHARFN